MSRSANNDLKGIVEAIEHLQRLLVKLTLEDKIDVAARNRAIAKAARVIDETIKDEITQDLKGEDGVRNGNIFKATRATHTQSTFDKALLAVDRPKIYAQYEGQTEVSVIRFTPR